MLSFTIGDRAFVYSLWLKIEHYLLPLCTRLLSTSILEERSLLYDFYTLIEKETLVLPSIEVYIKTFSLKGINMSSGDSERGTNMSVSQYFNYDKNENHLKISKVHLTNSKYAKDLGKLRPRMIN